MKKTKATKASKQAAKPATKPAAIKAGGKVQRQPLQLDNDQRRLFDAMGVSEEQQKAVIDYILEIENNDSVSYRLQKCWNNPEFSNNQVMFAMFHLGAFHEWNKTIERMTQTAARAIKDITI